MTCSYDLSLFLARPSLWAFGALLPLTLMVHTVEAAQLRLAWDPVSDDRLAYYEVKWGSAAGAYTESGTVSSTQAAQVTEFQTPDLGPGTYYFAVRACDAVAAVCSGYSNEISMTVRGPIEIPGGLRFMSQQVSSSGAELPLAEYDQAVVVGSLASRNNVSPATLQVSDGLLKVAEWPYLDQAHPDETANIVLVEAGRYVLEDGRQLEAGVSCCLAGASQQLMFSQPFSSVPVVFALPIASEALALRVSAVSPAGFSIRGQRQEAGGRTPGILSFYYLAIEQGDAQPFVGLIPATSQETPLPQSSAVAFAQTTNGADPAVARTNGVSVWMEEERSRDDEISHTAEVVGVLHR